MKTKVRAKEEGLKEKARETAKEGKAKDGGLKDGIRKEMEKAKGDTIMEGAGRAEAKVEEGWVSRVR